MAVLIRVRFGFALAFVWSVFAAASVAQEPQKIEFNRDIRPILSDKCFVCHGPDNNLRKGDLRLDNAEGALGDRGGYFIIAPGNPDKSELFRRVTSDNPAQKMPPRKSKKTLTTEEIKLLRVWIEQGGKYQKHWSLIPPTRPALPKVKNTAWIRNPIDQFVLARLEKEGVAPSAAADSRMLVRRLYFDLIGLPPSPTEATEFQTSENPRRVDQVIQRLFANKHFGERMAMYWLDVVRYADTGGYHSDNYRDVWLYRDYVIKSFNENLPYNKFLTEQLAGDLMPDPTRWQKIASGFNRLLQTTEEGGAQAKEYQAKYYADRVRNTGVAFMGLTMGCAECHDHKFDPILTEDFYEFAAFFADIQERSVGRQPQTKLPSKSQEEELAEIELERRPLQAEIRKRMPQLDKAQAEWEAEVRKNAGKGLPKNIAGLFKQPRKKWNKAQQDSVRTHFHRITPLLKDIQPKLAALDKRQKALDSQIPATLVSMSGNPQTIRILPRGNWLDASGKIVLPNVPDSLPNLEVKGRASRLDLAKWMTAKDNPLTARVFVNRLWLLFFGQGLVKSADDFGSQGTWPTHPELLDWLAVEFRDSGWNVQHMIRLMLNSNTYQQTSIVRPELAKIDPYNKLLARQARFRLEAEMVRDNALAISGLLVPTIGGPSVKPYQPAGYWKHLNFPKRQWTHDKGPNLYRRGLYTFWQRTFLHPSLLAFDAPSREECTVIRPRSNTPQQALALLNDPTFVEAARVLAESMMTAGKKDIDQGIHLAYQRAVNRDANAVELRLLKSLYQKHLQQYQKNPQEAEKLLSVGDRPAAKDLSRPELAAWTSVARVVLNLHETITRN